MTHLHVGLLAKAGSERHRKENHGELSYQSLRFKYFDQNL